jgi:hypothetical protein
MWAGGKNRYFINHFNDGRGRRFLDPPLSFRTVSFPQYGWKAGFPNGAFLGDRRLN